MNLWFTERETPSLALSAEVERVLDHHQTAFQDLSVLQTKSWGKLLTLDGAVMVTDLDEMGYHEMIAHVPLLSHPHPEKVLVIGGGDGGTVREVVKHAQVREVVLCELDPDVVAASRTYFPQLSSGLDDPRVRIVHEDGAAFVRAQTGAFDVIIVDSTDPVGPGKVLFEASFYASVREALRADGMVVAQSESPWYTPEIITDLVTAMRTVFPKVGLYTSQVPTYPGGLWTFTVGSLGPDPRQCDRQRAAALDQLRFYTPALHEAAFVLPNFVQELVQKAGGNL